MEDELYNLFGRKIDLLDRHILEKDRNYILRRQVLANHRTIFVAASGRLPPKR
jgi:hypothetical protein